MPHDTTDFLIVGAGFAGSILAERLAVDGGYRVLVVDRKCHHPAALARAPSLAEARN